MSLPSRPTPRRWASIAVIALLGGALMGGAGPVTAAAPSPAGANAPCADVAPLASVAAGQVGTGWTVVRGQTPRPFRVEILGSFPDGVGPDRDIILVEVSDLPGRSVVAAGGGIWSGMSGSPVYVAGRLVGAVAYSFSRSPSPIGGLTPAEDMARVLEMPEPAAARAAAAGVAPKRTRLSADLRRALARRTGTAVAAAGDFERLTLPLTVSGVPARGRQLLADRLEDIGVNARVMRGAAVASPAGSVATPVPGGNFAAMISYGDVTMGGIGTTTWVCGDRALAFGHPLALSGPASFGASDATSLAIVKDRTDGSYKMATLLDPFGSVDQDRLAAVRAHLGVLPRLYPLIARVRDLDLDVTRVGRTQVTSTDWMSYVAPSHVYADVISVTDREGPGTAAVRHAIQGQRADGTPWTLVVGDRLASSDIQFEVAYDLDLLLYQLVSATPEAISITRVASRITVEEAVNVARITRVQFARNGGAFTDPELLRLRAGDDLTVRVSLRHRDGAASVVDVALAVPDDVQGFGVLEVAGGAGVVSECDFDPAACGGGFAAVLQRLAEAPRGDELVVRLGLQVKDDFEEVASSRLRLTDVVTGQDATQVRVR